MTVPVVISDEIQSLWEKFISTQSLPENIWHHSASIQSFWQQSAYVKRISHSHVDWLIDVVENQQSDEILDTLFDTAVNALLSIEDENEFKQQLRLLRHHSHLHICW